MTSAKDLLLKYDLKSQNTKQKHCTVYYVKIKFIYLNWVHLINCSLYKPETTVMRKNLVSRVYLQSTNIGQTFQRKNIPENGNRPFMKEEEFQECMHKYPFSLVIRRHFVESISFYTYVCKISELIS